MGAAHIARPQAGRQHGRLHEPACVEGRTLAPLPAGHDMGTGSDAVADVAEDALHLLTGHDGPNVDTGLPARPETQLPSPPYKLIDGLVVDARLDEQSRSGGAILAHVGEDPPQRSVEASRRVDKSVACHLTQPVEDIQRAGRQARLFGELGQAQGAQRCLLGWLEDHVFPQASAGASFQAAIISG